MGGNMKKNIFIILLNVLIFSLCAQTFEGKGFESPEKAAKEYLNAMKKCDYDEIIKCYSIETFVENYNIDQYIKRLNCAPLTMKMIYPEDTFLKQTGKYEVLDSIIRMIKFQVWNLNENNFFKNAETVVVEDSSQNLINQVFPLEARKKLSSINFKEVVSVDSFLIYLRTGDFSSDVSDYEEEIDIYEQGINQYHEKMKLIYGCKNIQDVIVKFSIHGKEYYFITETIEYENGWYISPNQGIIANLIGMAASSGCIVSADELY